MMGISIHYRFAREQIPEHLMKQIEKFAISLDCKIEERSYNKLIISPHKNSEWIELHWHKYKTVKKREGWDYAKETIDSLGPIEDEDWVCSAFTKTQYAGAETHMKVISILRLVAAYCYKSEVSDEADYYEAIGKKNKGDALVESFDSSTEMINNIGAMLKKSFGAENIITGEDLCGDE